MRALPDATTIAEFLDRVRRRLLLLRAVEGAAVGLLAGALLYALGVRSTVLVALMVTTATVARVLFGESWKPAWWRDPVMIARCAERRIPLARNLIVTAAELPPGTTSYIPSLVRTHAARIIRGVDTSTLFPARRAAIAIIAGMVALSAAYRMPSLVTVVAPGPGSVPGAPAIHRMQVIITPPTYSGLQPRTIENPTRIEALAASRLELRVESNAASVGIETLAGTQDMGRGAGAFTATVRADADGFFAIEPRDSTGIVGARMLVGLSVIPDRAPRVELTSPGRDLFFSTVPGSIPVAIRANDDLGLASLTLRFTAVSGSGERFTFTERDVPIRITASTPQAWTAAGTWRLDQLELAPGDLLVYRAIATDRRPGATPVESESYVVEVVTPGAVAAEGFAADDERDRYAASQQMIILKTERLIARQASLPRDSVVDASLMLAAEQRQVRAEFVFMMGGSVDDHSEELSGTTEVNEVAEAEAESDLLEGRLQNQGRVDMMRAIRSMSRASVQLTDVNLEQALRDERTALENLMRAFARSRFILRALTQRERIDLERRLSGPLTLTAGVSGPTVTPTPDVRTQVLRRLLVDIPALATDAPGAEVRQRVMMAALELERSVWATDSVKALAARVQVVAARRVALPVNAEVDSLLRSVAALLSRSLPAAPVFNERGEVGVLRGALRDAARRAGTP